MNTQPSPSDDPLETLLRTHPAALLDDGFSARVLTALPSLASKPRKTPSRRILACGLGAVAGLIWALVQSGLPRINDFSAFGSHLQPSITILIKQLVDPTMLTLGAVIIAALAFAFAREIAVKLS